MLVKFLFLVENLMSDSDLLETALRETSEEIGLDVSKDQVVGQLTPVINIKFWLFDFTFCIYFRSNSSSYIQF